MNRRGRLRNKTTIFIDDGGDECEVDAEWLFTPYDPGNTFGPVEACYPPEGGELISCRLHLPDGTAIEDGEAYILAQKDGPDIWAVELEAALCGAESEREFYGD